MLNLSKHKTKTKLETNTQLRTAHVCSYHCAPLSYTTQHGTVLIIFPLILQTIIIAQMMSTGGKTQVEAVAAALAVLVRCAVPINLEMVHELVLGMHDVKQVLAGFLVHSVNHLVKHAIQVLHEHRFHCRTTQASQHWYTAVQQCNTTRNV